MQRGFCEKTTKIEITAIEVCNGTKHIHIERNIHKRDCVLCMQKNIIEDFIACAMPVQL